MVTRKRFSVVVYVHCLSYCHTNKLIVVESREGITVGSTKSLDAVVSGDPILPAPDQTGY
jgi:hypothetical protein